LVEAALANDSALLDLRTLFITENSIYQIDDSHLLDLIARYSFLQEFDPVFFQHLYGIIKAIINSHCVHSHLRALISLPSQLPTIFISSGIFTQKTQSFLWRRAVVILSLLGSLGFNDVRYTVTDKNSISSKSARKSKDPSDRLLGGWKLPFEAEVTAFVDLEVSKRASCFIPAHHSSSFSYMIMRQRELDSGILSSAIQKPFNEYLNWGF
jgi:hypothetical protein